MTDLIDNFLRMKAFLQEQTSACRLLTLKTMIY